MKIGINQILNIINTTNASIAHDGAATARFKRCRCIAVPAATVAARPVKGMVCPELMTKFVCNKIHIERISHRRRRPDRAFTLVDTSADHAQPRETASPCVEKMPHIKVCIADDRHRICVILDQGGVRGTIFRKRIRDRVGVNNQIVIGDKFETHREITFENTRDPIDRRHDGRQGAANGAAVKIGVLALRGNSQSIGAQARAGCQTRRRNELRGLIRHNILASFDAAHKVLPSELALAIARVNRRVISPKGINIKRSVRRQHLRMKALRRAVHA